MRSSLSFALTRFLCIYLHYLKLLFLAWLLILGFLLNWRFLLLLWWLLVVTRSTLLLIKTWWWPLLLVITHWGPLLIVLLLPELRVLLIIRRSLLICLSLIRLISLLGWIRIRRRRIKTVAWCWVGRINRLLPLRRLITLLMILILISSILLVSSPNFHLIAALISHERRRQARIFLVLKIALFLHNWSFFLSNFFRFLPFKIFSFIFLITL